MDQYKIWPIIFVILTLSALVACSPSGSSTGSLNCSSGREVCIKLFAVPSFEKDSPLDLKITVTSTKDISDLHLTLDTGTEVSLDGPQTWEKESKKTFIDRGVAYWDFSIKKGQSVTFHRVLHFSGSEGYYHIVATVVNTGRLIVAMEGFSVLLTDMRGQVALEGTRLPAHTPNVTSAVYGPGTPAPSPISNPTNPFKATPTAPAPRIATASTTAAPYPPPSAPSATRTPTRRAYP